MRASSRRVAAVMLLATTSASQPSAPAPVHEAPTPISPSELEPLRVDLPPIDASKIVTAFYNPFKQYEGGAIPNWRYGGDSTLFNDYMSLTPAAPNKVGWTWTTAASVLDSWEVEFDFHVGGAPSRGSGGGLAFWWTAAGGSPGTIYGNAENFKGLGIFFDTYETEPKPGIEAGNNEPYIVAMVNDGSSLTKGGSVDSTLLASKQVAVCFAHYRNLPNIARARVAWNQGQLKLWLDLEKSKVFQPCLETQIGDDRLRAMPKEGYFGLSASTGAYGDAHVLYTVTAAQLDATRQDPQVVATPHVAQPGEKELPADHVVHADAPTDHETHVNLVPTELPPEALAAEGAGAHGEAGPDHPHPVHVPPMADTDEQLEHVLHAMEAQRELRDALDAVKDEVSQLVLTHNEKAQELLNSLNTLKLESKQTHTAVLSQHQALEALTHHTVGLSPPGSPTSAVAGGAAASAGAGTLPAETLKRIDEMTHGLAEAKLLVQKTTEKEGEHHLAREKAERSHASSLAEIVSKLNSLRLIEDKVNTMSAAVAHTKSEMDGLRDTTRALVSEIRSDSAALKQAVEDLHAKSSSGGWLFPLCVCAQALVVAAGLFYSAFGGGGGKKSKGYLD